MGCLTSGRSPRGLWLHLVAVLLVVGVVFLRGRRVNAPGRYIFNPDPRSIKESFANVRNRLAETHKNPRFKQIYLHTFRHYYACRLYRKTKNLKTVQDALGHKSIMNTEIYTRIVVFQDEEYNSATAKTVEEVQKLAEDGWSYFCEIDGIKVFRKPK